MEQKKSTICSWFAFSFFFLPVYCNKNGYLRTLEASNVFHYFRLLFFVSLNIAVIAEIRNKNARVQSYFLDCLRGLLSRTVGLQLLTGHWRFFVLVSSYTFLFWLYAC